MTTQVRARKRYGDTIEEVQNKGGFFEGIKQGFIDFVENVAEQQRAYG